MVKQTDTYTTEELEKQVAQNTHNMRVWVATQSRTQKEFFVNTKQTLWLATTNRNFLPLQDISRTLDSLSTVTGGVIAYNKQFVRLIQQMAGGTVNINGTDFFDNKKSLLVYKNKVWKLAEGATWEDIRPLLSSIPKTTMKIISYMQVKNKPANNPDKYIRVLEKDFLQMKDLAEWLHGNLYNIDLEQVADTIQDLVNQMSEYAE